MYDKVYCRDFILKYKVCGIDINIVLKLIN